MDKRRSKEISAYIQPGSIRLLRKVGFGNVPFLNGLADHHIVLPDCYCRKVEVQVTCVVRGMCALHTSRGNGDLESAVRSLPACLEVRFG